MRRLVFLLFVSLSAAPFALAQSADQQIVSAVDSPDPVVPGTSLTYTVTFRNNGPDAATNGGVNLIFDGNFTPTSVTPPAGFTCTALAQFMTCSTPSFAAGSQFVLTATGTVAAHLLNFADGSLSSLFTTSGTTADPNNANNSVTVTTTYNSPQIDLQMAVTDNPDPVVIDNNITYTATATNAGPDTATSTTFSMFNSNNLRFQSATVPAGWNCTLPPVNGNPTFSCTKASMTSGETAQFIIVVRASSEVLGTTDGQVSSVFQINGTGDDTADANNSETETTNFTTPDADMAISVTDSPDPVFPDGDITYTATVQNNGPDPATNATFSIFNNNVLRFRSATIPAGWTCTLPPVDGNPTFSCTNPSLANGASAVFTVVVRAYQSVVGITDTTVSSVFTASSSRSDPVPGNNQQQVDTAYVTADANLSVTASDSPDPVTPDNNITYTITVANAGPDAAPNAQLGIFNNGSLRFQSITEPAGWSCAEPAVNATPSFNCTNASFASGANSVFTLVVRADSAILGINDSTVSTTFSVSSAVADPVSGNNLVQVDTHYATPDANLAITATDAPDPVVNGGNLTFMINVTSAGPDTPSTTTMTASPDPSLTFQSIAAPAGWTCTTPAVNAAGTTTCTHAAFANGGNAQFTLVTRLVASGSGGTLTSNFTTHSNIQDPVTTNNSVQVPTNWIGQTSDLAITKTTLQTAAAQGSTLTYTLATQNNGPTDAANVTVTDTLPAQLLFQSITAPAGWSCTTPAVGANGTITCTTALLANGATANFTLVTSVAPNATGTIQNSASIGFSGGTDPNGGNSSNVPANNSVAVAGNADLRVTKGTGSTSVSPNGTLTYTITLTNLGTEAAASVVMTDVLPASLLFQSISAPAGFTCTTPAPGANGTITCTSSTLANGATATFTLNVTVTGSASGNITNPASASHSGTDPNPANNHDSMTTPVTPPATTADLAVTKTSSVTTAPQFSTVPFTITITNNGPDTATNVGFTDVLQAELLFQSLSSPAGYTCTTPAAGTNGTITCSGGTLANGATATFNLVVQMNGSSGTVVNGVTIVSDAFDPTPGNAGATSAPIPGMVASADVSIAKSTTSSTYVPGDTIAYTITVVNSGPSPATNVTVTDALNGVELISVTPSQGSCSGTTTITCNLGTLADDAMATITLNVRATAAGSPINNSATVSAPEDPNAANNTGAAPPIAFSAGGAPTLSEWALILLIAGLALVALIRM
jgi:large repetitive protein